MDPITVDEAEDILGAQDGRLVAWQEQSKHRWYTRFLMVFRDGGQLYGFHYDDPATEEQEGQDVFEAVPVPVFPVTSKQIVTTIYEKRRTDIKAQGN